MSKQQLHNQDSKVKELEDRLEFAGWVGGDGGDGGQAGSETGDGGNGGDGGDGGITIKVE